MFLLLRETSNNDNKICLLPSFACLQQHFHDWFSVPRYNSDNNYYYLTPTNSVICQINPNLFPFQLVNMPCFHIRLQHVNLNYSLISSFPNCSLKMAQFVSFFIFSHVFTALEFDSSSFYILL